MKAFAGFVCAAIVAAGVSLAAHQETFKGKALAVKGTSVQVNVVDAKTKKTATKTFTTDAATKVLRGDAIVTLANAKIKVGESIAVTVDHDEDVNMALVIRLDAAK